MDNIENKNNEIKETQETILKVVKKRIKFTDLENIEVFASKEVIKQFPLFINNFRKFLGIEYNEILGLLNLGNDKYTREQYKLVTQYNNLEKEHEKQLFLNNNKKIDLDIINDISLSKTQLTEKLNKIPSKFVDFITNGAEQTYDQFIDILVLATDDIDRQTFENSDIRVLIELGLRLFNTPDRDMQKALFLSHYRSAIVDFIQSFGFMKSVKKLILKEEPNE